jgi:peptide deformylase
MSNSVPISRRQWLLGFGAAGAVTLMDGCALSGSDAGRSLARLTSAERKLLAPSAQIQPLAILQYQLAGTNLGAVLRQRALAARDLPRRSLARLDRLMRATLTRSGGVGLAAPQVGFSRRMALVQLQNGSDAKQVLTCVDPRILRRSADRVDGYEACLSIRGVGGKVARARWVDLSYYDLAGRLQKRRSTGWEARIFQHELDHLDGRLYVDRVNGPLLPMEELRRRRRARRRRPSALWAPRSEPPNSPPMARSPVEPDGVVLL